jgi:hypothetical protein
VRTYQLGEFSLELAHDADVPTGGLESLLEDLSFAEADGASGTRFSLRLTVGRGGSAPVSTAETVFDLDGLRGMRAAGEFWLTDGETVMHLRPPEGTAEVRLHDSFLDQEPMVRRNFWAFGLMKLLRARDHYALHAACLVSRANEGLLIVAAPGSGKSTLTLGLLGRGWRYLSDDAVLLRRDEQNVVALALRKWVYVDASAGHRYAHVDPVGVADGDGGLRHRIDVERSWPGRTATRCLPRTLIFPSIADRPQSRLEPLAPAATLGVLLRESGPQLFEPEMMGPHMETLRLLVAQCRCFALHSGRDLLDDPGALETMLADARS